MTTVEVEPPPTVQKGIGGRLKGWLAAFFLLCAMVGALVMQQASQLLASVQSAGQSVYTMDALTRVPIPFKSDQILGAFEAWRGAAALPTAADPNAVDEALLDLILSWIRWHVLLDVVLFAPAIALILYWLLGRAFLGSRKRVRVILPLAYLFVDWAETIWTGVLAERFLGADGRPELSSSGTWGLLILSGLKWSLLLVNIVVIIMGSLVREDRFSGIARLGRCLWAVRVQFVSVLIFGVLIALPISGPLDQIPDLLRSTHDESWFSTAVLFPTLILLGFCALIWGTGLLIIHAVSTQQDPGQVEEGAVANPPPAGATAADGKGMGEFVKEYLLSRLPWIVLVFLVLTAAAVLVQALQLWRPSNGIWAASVIAGSLLLLDFVLEFLRWSGKDTRINGRPPRLREQDMAALGWTVVALAAAPLAIGGCGAVRAYGALVLLQSGDSTREVHPGATPWFWFGAGATVLLPLAAVGVMRKLNRLPSESRFTLAIGTVVVLTWSATALAIYVAIDPADAGAALQAHGVVTLWLSIVVAYLGLLQWVSEKEEPVPLAQVLGMARTPWVACVVLVPLLASTMDSKVGYHAVTVETQPVAQVKLADAFASWYENAQRCRPDEEQLPLVLVAAPGGGARAAYWTGQVMSGLQGADACGGDSVFAASGVSGGSVGLAVWSATAADGVASTNADLEKLVGPEALSATVAAMLFRDLPRSFVGIHPYGVDRAAVEQDVWTEQIPEMGEAFFDTSATGDWRPVLILNSSDIATGCKILVSQIEVRSAAGEAREKGCKQAPSTDSGPSTALEAGSVDAVRFLDPADCADPDRADQNLSMATASLLSARFPYVSPAGTMTACGSSDDEPERLFAGDGGYLENSGLHTLLALWEDLEPLIEEQNAKNGPDVLPLGLLVDNHYRSQASVTSGSRARELTGPPNADRTALVGAAAIEQAFAAEFSQSLSGFKPLEAQDKFRWFVIAPSTRPDISAPLGWSLSKATRQELDCQIPESLQGDQVDASLSNRGKKCAGSADQVDPRVERLVELMAAH